MTKLMAGTKASVILVLLLIGATFALGTEFSQTQRSAPPAGGSTLGPGAGYGTIHTTELVVDVQEIRQAFWNASATVRPPSDSMFAPVVGLSLAVTQQSALRPRPVLLSTNSTGVATFQLAAGSYALQTSTPTFSLNILANVTKGFTTFVHVKVYPLFSPVVCLVVSNPDEYSAVEPSSLVYAEVNSSLPAGPPIPVAQGQFVQLVGPVHPGTSFPVDSGTFRLNATALGSYESGDGVWVALRAFPPPSSLPEGGMQIMIYVPTYTESEHAS